MERDRRRLATLLDFDARVVRYRLQEAFNPEDGGHADYLQHAMTPGTLWPPVWLDRLER